MVLESDFFIYGVMSRTGNQRPERATGNCERSLGTSRRFHTPYKNASRKCTFRDRPGLQNTPNGRSTLGLDSYRTLAKLYRCDRVFENG